MENNQSVTFSPKEAIALGNLIEGHPVGECLNMAMIIDEKERQSFIVKIKSLPYTEIPTPVPTLNAM